MIGYSLLVAFSGWAFVHLALGAFNLFDPVALGREPLLALYKAIDQLESRGLSKNEAVVRVASQEANKALFVLAELIDLTGSRVSVDWGRMAIVDTKPFKLRVILHRIFVERPQVTGIPAWPGGAACYRRSQYIL